MRWFYVAVKAAFAGVFGSAWSRLFPAKTADAQRADDLGQSLRVAGAEAQAAAGAPTDKASLIDTLKRHQICLVAGFCLSLVSCAQNVGSSCPVPRQWTDRQQDEIAANLSTLPPDSPIIAVGVEWERLRQESKACLKNEVGDDW